MFNDEVNCVLKLNYVAWSEVSTPKWVFLAVKRISYSKYINTKVKEI